MTAGSVAAPAADAAPRGAASDRRVRWSDVALLVLALVVTSALVGPGLFTVDESAYRSQARWVDEGGTWLQPYVVPDLGPGGEPAPLALSTRTEQGWAAYSKAPLYVLTLVAARQVHPDWGPVALSGAGLVLLAVAIGWITRRIDPAAERSAFWLAAAATPLTVHTQIVWAHTLLAAAVALGVLALLRLAAEDRRLLDLVAAVVSLSVAVLLRSEAMLFTAAALAVFGVELVRFRRWSALLCCAAAATATVVGQAVNGALVRHALGVATPSRVPAGSGSLTDRITSVWTNMLSPGVSPDPALLGRLVSVLLLAYLAVTIRRGRREPAPLVVLGTSAVVLGVWGATAGDTYHGLLPAVPLLLVALLLAGAAPRPPEVGRLLLLASTFAAGVVLVSEPTGGGLGWGGRYVMVAAALLVPVAAVGLQRVELRQDRSAAGVVVAAGVVAVAVQLAGLTAVRSHHAASEAFTPLLVADLATVAGRGPLLITTDLRIGRAAPEVARTAPLLSVDGAELGPVLGAIAERDLRPPLLVGLDAPAAAPPGWRIGRTEQLPALFVSHLVPATG